MGPFRDEGALREAMVAELLALGTIRDDAVAAAFRAVPRHRFAPGTDPADAYAVHTAVVTKRDEHGVPVSSVSAPEIQALMLAQAGIEPGMAVLEIGSGGYNAALIAELVGPGGAVTSVDIDPDVTGRARRLLADTGYSRVRVVLADAEHGVPEHAPYDRIIVTVGAWDVPPAWIDQLTPDGLLVVPLRVRGLTRSMALARVGDRLVSRSSTACGFVLIRGAGAHAERVVPLRGKEVVVRFDDDDEPGVGEPDLDGVPATDRVEVWTGVVVDAAEPVEDLQLWLATTLPGAGALVAAPGANLVAPGNRWFPQAAVRGGAVAYLVSRPVAGDRFELGAHAFGRRADELAGAFAERITAWDGRRDGPGPVFTVWRGTSGDPPASGTVIRKRHSRVTVTWPDAEG
ncbi:methyltransferase, FxLD system [Saccharothrix australiensis]|uniref:Protein-L-isoaspartate O-methyltransferase n=1 Tax=Saccharothrix australiensis TaxID=2072 RepID=A0A495VU85_9PSEU|nr:methyltransferase, FxLD system [Saccharothrix australiensis]RKT52033.1 protein-L-isoaspartate(D-aspartate) O-methyltransferase [Saccharothrix australiensis]